MASRRGVPILIQEQNAYAGITNRLLSKKAQYICVAYSDMGHCFPEEKLKLTGNPIRAKLFADPIQKPKAKEALGFQPDEQLIFSFGGSQGSRSLNRAWKRAIDALDVQLLWQTGALEYPDLESLQRPGVRVVDFMADMALAYAAADLVVSRAGALALSELSALGKACILVPLPTAAADHQTKNAAALADAGAALVLSDAQASEELWPRASALLEDAAALADLERHIASLAKPNATTTIVDLIFNLIV